MHRITFAPIFAEWQRAARLALQHQWPPEQIMWQELSSEQRFLDICEQAEFTECPNAQIKVPRTFIDLAKCVACHADRNRWRLLYQVLWRFTHGENHLMQIFVDPDMHRLKQMEKAVRRDVHKMRAFVRFRVVEREGVTWYVAWFEPQHHIVEYNSSFFVGRFANMCWSILTPNCCVYWDKKNLTFTEGVTRAEAPSEDKMEMLWIKYYSHIFNPARIKIRAMEAEMPKKYWKNLPETAVISDLLRQAPGRVKSMVAKSTRQ